MESKITDSILVGIGNKHITKPNDYGVIESKKKAVSNYGYYEIDKLADMVGKKGYSVVPSYLFNENKAKMNKPSMKQEDFVSCQMFMIDFDGRKYDDKKKMYTGTNISFDEIKKRADDNGIPIAFAYKTLSCPDTNPYYKYRIAFIHDQVIHDRQIATLIYKALGRIFHECDQACCEVSRMFLGGKERIYFDKNARVNLVQIIHSLYRALDVQGHFQRNLRSFMRGNNIKIAVMDNHIVN